MPVKSRIQRIKEWKAKRKAIRENNELRGAFAREYDRRERIKVGVEERRAEVQAAVEEQRPASFLIPGEPPAIMSDFHIPRMPVRPFLGSFAEPFATTEYYSDAHVKRLVDAVNAGRDSMREIARSPALKARVEWDTGYQNVQAPNNTRMRMRSALKGRTVDMDGATYEVFISNDTVKIGCQTFGRGTLLHALRQVLERGKAGCPLNSVVESERRAPGVDWALMATRTGLSYRKFRFSYEEADKLKAMIDHSGESEEKEAA